MASFMAKVKKIPHELPHGTARSGLKGFIWDKGERYGAAFAFGAAKGYYGDRFVWKNHGLDMWLGAGALAASVVSNAFNVGTKLAPHLERIGDAGVMSALNSLGAHWGITKAGGSVQLSHPSAKAALPGGRPQTMLGHIPPAGVGAFLTPNDIAKFAARR